jgi:hypothetical protein
MGAPGGQDAPTRFTRKVDIWAFGCIIFELLTSEKAFANDFDLYHHHYFQGNTFKPISLHNYPPFLQQYLSQTVRELLDGDPNKRPSISQLHPLFDTYSAITDLSILQSFNDIDSHPPYSLLKEVITDCEGKAVLLSHAKIAEWYTGNKMHPVAIRLLERAVDQSPGCDELILQLDRAYVEQGNTYFRMLGWLGLRKRHLSARQIWHQLVRACRELKDLEMTFGETRQNVTLQRYTPPVVDTQGELYCWKVIIGDQVSRLTSLEVLENAARRAEEIAVLRKYCSWRRHVDKAIVVWEYLVAFCPNYYAKQ